MKSDIAYYLLILYICAMCKPVFPLVQDELAHFFWKAEHIGTVHNHHGNHHAEDEVAAAAQEEQNNKTPSTSKMSEDVSIHIILESFHIIPQLFIEKRMFGIGIYKLSSLLLEKPFPPPRSC